MASQFRSSITASLERFSFSQNMEAGQFGSGRFVDSVPRRVFVDATYTLGSGRRSGVERVVHNLKNGCERLAREQGSYASTLMSMNGSFYEIGPIQQRQLEDVARTQADILSSFPRAYRSCIGPLVRWSGSQKLKTWMMPDPGHMGLFKLPYRFWYRQKLQSIFASTPAIEPGRGDLLIMPDAYWARKEIWSAVATARQRGAYAAFVVYDLIPLTHPEFVGQRRTRRFAEYIVELARSADMILTISETVRQDLIAALPALMGDQPYCQNIEAFPLGAEFSQTEGYVRPELRQAFSQSPNNNPFLTVAAFDPRKNHRYLLDAFDRLWEQHPQHKLCLVGRVGSRCDGIMERIRQHPQLGQQLFMFHDLTDAELQFCYRSCRSVIFPSIVEGFGLPIVEALWHGLPTLASDTPIHREVGGERVQYFNLDDPQSLVDLVIEQDKSGCARSLRCYDESVRPHSWSDSAKIFFDKCLHSYRAHRQLPLARSA